MDLKTLDNETTAPEATVPPIVNAKQALRLSGRPFLLINFVQRAAVTKHEHAALRVQARKTGVDEAYPQLTKTHVKGWCNVRDNLVTYESIEIVDRIKDRHLSRSAVIIDILRGDLIKSNLYEGRTEATDHQTVEHFLSKYMEECKQGVDRYLTKMATEHLKTNSLESLKEKLAAASPDAGITA